MNVPMSCLALYLMICSCGMSLLFRAGLLADTEGCVMRAARNEIFGSDEEKPSTASTDESRDNKDLTSSRLQSELYCELKASDETNL
jgi:hypothetical protein